MELLNENNILILKMDAPGNNIMTGEFLDDIVHCLEQAESYKNDSGVKGMVITCAGRHFSCGADISSLMERSAEELKEMDKTNVLPQIHQKQKHALTMLNTLPFPVISVVKGFCIGSGSEIAANSHIRVCEHSARIGQPESTFGILPALGGIAKTVEICGLSEAIEMILTGELFGTDEAYEKQWCDLVCEKKQGLDTAINLINFISENYDSYDRKKSPVYVEDFSEIKNTRIKNIKKIGVIGYGKMGKEIFSSLHDKILDAEFTVICRHDIDVYSEQIQKNVAKAYKRGRLSEIAYKISSRNFRFSDDLSSVSDCDLIIETISENLASKKAIFSELEKIAKPECVFSSNTSSFLISDVFSDITIHPYMGIHFFYPVKLSGVIEYNNCCDNKLADSLSKALGKESVFFENTYCMYLNQFISYSIACALVVKEKYNLTTKSMMNVLSDIFPQHGLFGMIDSIGLDLLTSGNTSDNVERIRCVLDYIKGKFRTLLSQGCPGGTQEFINFVNSQESEFSEPEISADYIKTLVVSALLNECVNASEDCKSDLTTVLADTIGLNLSMGDYYKSYGYETVKECLSVIDEELTCDAFKPVSEDVFNKYFSK